jgi:hypothetical protein
MMNHEAIGNVCLAYGFVKWHPFATLWYNINPDRVPLLMTIQMEFVDHKL